MSIQSATTISGEIKPRIILTASDHERLSLLARAAETKMPDLVSVLAEELDRAEILPHGYPEHTVCMGSEVEFREDTTGRVQTVTLVFPGDADIAQRKISVLTPVGTALIGMRAGDSISFEARDGELRRLTVLSAGQPQPAN